MISILIADSREPWLDLVGGACRSQNPGQDNVRHHPGSTTAVTPIEFEEFSSRKRRGTREFVLLSGPGASPPL